MENPSPRLSTRLQPTLPAILLLAGLYLAIVAMRWFLIQEYGSQIPFWDQWLNDAPLLAAIAEGRFHLGLLFAAVNEHYILWTKFTVIAAYLGNNGQWDAQVLATFNAFLGAGVTVVALWIMGRRGLGLEIPQEPDHEAWRLDFGAYAVAALVWATPLLYYNALWSFQNQFYFMLIWSMAGIHLVLKCRELSAGWWAGLGCLLAAQLSMGSGMLATAAVVAAVLARWIRQRAWDRGQLWTVIICGGLVLAAVLLKPQAPMADSLGAGSVGEALNAVSKHFSWPWTYDITSISLTLEKFPVELNKHLWAMLLWLPAPLLVVIAHLRPSLIPRFRLRLGELEVLTAITLWLYGMIMLLAVLRGAQGRPPSLRHYDVHALGPLLNFVALGILLRGQVAWIAWSRFTPRARRVAALVLPCLFLGGLAAGVFQQMVLSAPELRQRLVQNAAQAQNIRAFLATRDPAHLVEKPLFHIPFIEPNDIIACLEVPSIRRMLPASIRDPLPLTAEGRGQFTEGGVPPYAPMPPYRRVWGNWTPGETDQSTAPELGTWVVPPSRFPYLILEYTGVFEEGKPPVFSVSQNGRERARSQIEYPPDRRWDSATISLPQAGRRELRATHLGGPNGWMAVMDPVECGWLTYWTKVLRSKAHLVFGVGLACILAGVALGRAEPEYARETAAE